MRMATRPCQVVPLQKQAVEGQIVRVGEAGLADQAVLFVGDGRE